MAPVKLPRLPIPKSGPDNYHAYTIVSIHNVVQVIQGVIQVILFVFAQILWLLILWVQVCSIQIMSHFKASIITSHATDVIYDILAKHFPPEHVCFMYDVLLVDLHSVGMHLLTSPHSSLKLLPSHC